MTVKPFTYSLDVTRLSEALNLLHEKLGGYGAWKEMERASGLRSSSIARIARKEGTPLPDSWERLHKAFPKDIPAPPWEEAPALTPQLRLIEPTPSPPTDYAEGVECWRQAMKALAKPLRRGWQTRLANRAGCANSTISGALSGGNVSHRMRTLLTSYLGEMVGDFGLTPEKLIARHVSGHQATPPPESTPKAPSPPSVPAERDVNTLADLVKQREAYIREDGVDALAQAAEYWRRVAEVGVSGSPKPELVMQLLAIGIAEAVYVGVEL